MHTNFTSQEGAALYGLLADTTTDIIVRTDEEGFIVHASPAISRLGIHTANMLIAPHILDLVHPSWIPKIRLKYARAVRRSRYSEWIEFKARSVDDTEQWFLMKFRHLEDDNGSGGGVLVVLRNIDERKSLEARLFAASRTDPLTGLSNREAFTSMLHHLVRNGARGCMALFDIDHFKTMNLKFGFASGDELLVAFSRFLCNSLRPQDVVSRMEGDRFGAIILDVTPSEAKALADNAIATFAGLGQADSLPLIRLTTSCGIAQIDSSFDTTMAKADRARFGLQKP